MHTPLRLLRSPIRNRSNPSPSLSDLPRYGPGVPFLYFSYLSFLTHADMGKTQDEDIVHAYNLIHSVISDIAIFRENIEKDFHDWFMDASRIGSELGIVLTVPRLSGRQQHRANAGPENPDPEVYYRINVAIPFLDHMEQVLNNRFHRDSMVGSHLFYLVPTLIINHSDLQDLAKCLLFWKRDLPSASSLLSELKQWQRFWKLKSESLDNIIPADLAHCIHAADEDVFPTYEYY